MDARYKKALELVADLFRDINRHVTGLPFIVHLAGVSHILSKYTDDEDVIIAGLLHDVLEDIDAEIYSEADMRRDFGDKITDIVKTVSHDESRYSKEEARQIYLQQIENGSDEAILVSGADLLYNAIDIVQGYNSYRDEMKAEFGGRRAVVREWFWGTRQEIIVRRLGENHGLSVELQPVMKSLLSINKEMM